MAGVKYVCILPRRLNLSRNVFCLRSGYKQLAAFIGLAVILSILLKHQLTLANQLKLREETVYTHEGPKKLGPEDQLVWKLRDFRVKELNCLRLISGDQAQLTKGLKLSLPASSFQHPPPDDDEFLQYKCSDYYSRFVMFTMSDEERHFPMAFSIMVYKDFHQVLRLLTAIYRPEHTYCIHVDRKSNKWFHKAVNAFADCLSNVIIAKPSVIVVWHRYSVLEAELSCWKTLLEMGSKWKYLINLTGQEYPLRTMKEMVRILTQLRGANSIENVGPITSYPTPKISAAILNTSSNIVWHKGSVHVIVTRGFAQFVFSPVGMALQTQLRKQDALQQKDPPPDEVLFATLNYNSGILEVPGAPMDSNLTTDNVKLPFFPRYKNWLVGVFGYPCLSGRQERGICIWGLADLPAMNQRFELFANKFFADFQPLALRCLEERFWHNTMADYGMMGLNKTWQIDLKKYSNYSFVQYHT